MYKNMVMVYLKVFYKYWSGQTEVTRTTVYVRMQEISVGADLLTALIWPFVKVYHTFTDEKKKSIET